jgi:hypothetical protein
MYVKNFYQEATETLGTCQQTTVFRRITDAVRRMNNKSIPDITISQFDACVCSGCVSLPRDVGTILGVNIGGHPTLLRDEFFHWHVNGPGDNECQPCQYTDELGEWCTQRDPSAPVYLVAELETVQDNNKSIRVFGTDVNGKHIWTTNPLGELSEGFLVPTIYGSPVRSNEAPPIARIDRIQKDITVGFVRLVAINPSDLSAHTLIGYYEPNETEPRYRRIRVPDRAWVRIKYKKKDYEVTSMEDWVNTDSHEALMYFLKAVKQSANDRFDLAAAAEAAGVKLINEEAEAKRPKNALSGPQVVYSDWPTGSETMFYSH